jgi:regulator of RNase E activity RraB
MRVDEVWIRNEVAAHEARNHELLKRVLAHPADPSAPRTIDVFFWSESLEAANTLAAALAVQGCSSVQIGAGSGQPRMWSIGGQVETSAEAAASLTFTESFVRLAAAHGSSYDGWGTEL